MNGNADGLRVSVIVPHYNDLENLDLCLRLLQAQTLPRDAFEVVVADNNSRCGLEAVRRLCGDRARVEPAPIQGAGEARNAGVAASRGEVLAFIDSDCRPHATWLQEGLAALGETNDVIGGRVEVDVGDPQRMTGVESFEKIFAFDFKTYVEKKGFSGSGNLFVRRAAFDKIGGFRVGVAEDNDWSERAVRLGHRLRYADNVIVSHPARRDWAELKGKWRRLTREAFLRILERPRGRIIWFARSFLILASPFAHMFSVLRSSKVTTARERAGAIVTLFRIRFWRFFECQRLLLQRTR